MDDFKHAIHKFQMRVANANKRGKSYTSLTSEEKIINDYIRDKSLLETEYYNKWKINKENT